MFKSLFLAFLVVMVSFAAMPEKADAFGGRGYARRQARRATYHSYHSAYRPVVSYRPVVTYRPVVVHKVYTPPVVAPVYVPAYSYRPVVPVPVVPYSSYYAPAYPVGSVSVHVGW